MALLQLQGFVAPLLALLPDYARAGGREGKNTSVYWQNRAGCRPAKKHLSLLAEHNWGRPAKNTSVYWQNITGGRPAKNTSVYWQNITGADQQKTCQFTGRT